MNRKILRIFRYLIAIIFGLLPVVFIYQNCGNVGLKANYQPIDGRSITSLQTRGIVPLPTPTSGELRAVFFVDNSRSMVQGLCVDSMDIAVFPNPPAPVRCGENSSISGVDHDLKRVKIIRQWISELEQIYQDRPDLLAKVKMLILPFSGGSAQGAIDGYFGYLPAAKQFSSLSEIKRVLDRIETMQSVISGLSGAPKPDAQTAAMPRASVEAYLGTSVPAGKFESSLHALYTELELLKNKPGSRFEYVFISDGVPKPRADHIVASAIQIWENATSRMLTGRCLIPPGPMPSNDPDDPTQLECFEPEYQDVGFNQCRSSCQQAIRDWATIGAMTMAQQTSCRDCLQALAKVTQTPFTDKANQLWGSSLDNTPQGIFRALGKIKTQQDQYPDVSYRFNFLQLDTLSPLSFATPALEKTADVNWEVRSAAIYKSGHRTTLVTTPQAPFGLFPGLSKNESYKLDSIVALNINVRVNSVGVLDLDSDGDGLFDYEERQLPLADADPQKARTNGACLDSITYSMGCITAGCDPNIDSDGDGLNECEERTLGTSDQDFDFDGDGIPDSMEVIYGYNPTVSDRDANSSVDQIDNYEQWKMGVPGSFSVDNTPEEYLTHVLTEFLGQKSVQDNFNRTILVPEYLFQIQNMHTGNAKAAQDIGPMYTSKTKSPSTIVTDRLVGGSHAANVNRIIVLGKVVSVQNVGDAYWIGKMLEVTHDPNGQVIDLPFDQLKPLKVNDLQEGAQP